MNVAREQLPLTLSLFTLSGNSVVPAGNAERGRMTPSVQFEDCGDRTFLGYMWRGQFYLVRRNEVVPQLSCTCVKPGADVSAGVAGLGRCSKCP